MLALAGFTIGLVVNISASKRMRIIGKIAADSGRQFNATRLEELQKLRNKSFTAANVIAVLLFTSLIPMSIVKYY